MRIGYYVDNDFEDEALREAPPANIADPQVIDILKRNILVDKPRVTRFNIKWDPTKLNEAEDISELINLKVDDASSEGDDSWSESAAEDEEDDAELDDESNTSMDEDAVDDSAEPLPSESNMMDIEHTEESIAC